MQKIVSIILLSLANLANAIVVYTLDEQYSQVDQTVLRFRIENNSSDTLNGVELRYHVVQNTSNIDEPDLYYLPGGMANWSFDDSVNATLVIYFPTTILYPGDTLGGISGFSVGLHNHNWSIWTKNDDPSQPKSNTFTIANNVEIMSGGQLLMSDVEKHAGCPSIQFIEIQKDSVSLLVLQQSSSDSPLITIKNKNGYLVTANLNATEFDSIGQKIWHGYMPTQDSIEHRGELTAECNGNILAYFAYGWKPTNAAAAVSKKLWESAETFVKADFDMGFNQGLIEGQRIALQKDSLGKFLDAKQAANWKFYRSWEIPGENPMPTIRTQMLMRYNQQDIDSLFLEWSPIEGCDLYHLIVIQVSTANDSVVYGDTIVSKPTENTSIKIEVPSAGKYIWYVEPLVEVDMSEEDERKEYYYVNGDVISHEPRRGLWKRFENWAKKTVSNVVQTFTPITYTLINDGSLIDNIGTSIAHLNPIGIILTFVPTQTMHEKVNIITKNMKWLQETYKEEYIHEALPTNACFGSSAFCAMKDTRMLAENWSVGFNETNWDKIFLKYTVNGNINDAVRNRCWLTMAQMINHYKGGNIASDEILYNVRGGFSNTTGSNPIESMQSVSYALKQTLLDQTLYTFFVNAYHSMGVLPTDNGWTSIFPISHTVVNTSIDGWLVGTPRLNTIISTIESGNVLGVSQLNDGAGGFHAMVLNGYRIDTDGKVYIHLLNTHNMGEEEWRYYCNISFLGVDLVAQFIANGIGQFIDYLRELGEEESPLSGDMFITYYIPPFYANGRLTDESIFNDSDGDGIVDIDENKRFRTNAFNPDSDGDGINDYDEIYEYKLCETYSGKFMPHIEVSFDEDGNKKIKIHNEPQLQYRTQSDFDQDGLHAAIDPDSDGDGYCDIDEKGFIGNLEIHNCERFDASKHPDGVIPRCRDNTVALLAKEKIQLNDRATCVSLNGSHCPVASYGTAFNNVYGVSLGVSAFVGNIYSAKSILLRDRANVYGNIETGGSVVKQSSTSIITGRVVENSILSSAYTNLYASVLDNATHNIDFTIYRQHSVNSNEITSSYIFGIGANNTDFNFNSGSNLIFDLTGNLLAGSLKFQDGARLYAPTENVVFHIGNDFQWNGKIVTDNMVSAAQHIMLYYYGTNKVFVQTDFAGTIIAPNAEVVVGQSGKHFYGAIFAKSIVIHQNTMVTWVPFVESTPNTIIAKKNLLNQKYTINFWRI